ncbi:MAG: Rieske (2Fe-2S) protein [Chloroflexi bacterium]|nr:Rieske (2Fe-2S) protein [Chloroflexota bacterium]
MPEYPWVATLDESQLTEGNMAPVFPRGLSMLLIRKGGRVYALANRCAHMGCTLAGGQLDGPNLQCECHDWKYDISTGEFVDAPMIRIPTYQTRSEAGKIWVKLEG